MGAGGVPNRSVYRVEGRHGDLLVKNAKPNSRYDLYVNGNKVQSRWYDSNGNAIRNRDYMHQDAHNNHVFPHDHIWNWNNGFPARGREGIEPDYNNYN